MSKQKRTNQFFKRTRGWFYTFYTNPDNQNYLDILENEYLSPNYYQVWTIIEKHFFDSGPGAAMLQNEYYQNQNRYDVLLHTCGAVDADQRVRAIIKRLKRENLNQKQEAA